MTYNRDDDFQKKYLNGEKHANYSVVVTENPKRIS